MINRYKLRRSGTSWVLAVPASISGTVHYPHQEDGRRTASDPYSSRAEFTCHVNRAGSGAVPEIVYRPANAAARKMLIQHLSKENNNGLN